MIKEKKMQTHKGREEKSELLTLLTGKNQNSGIKKSLWRKGEGTMQA